jgi:hypothetical protein
MFVNEGALISHFVNSVGYFANTYYHSVDCVLKSIIFDVEFKYCYKLFHLLQSLLLANESASTLSTYLTDYKGDKNKKLTF